MGYRSHVIYAIIGPTEKMVAFATAATLHSPSTAAAIAELKFMEYGPDQLVLAADFQAVKWYDSYTDVISHNDLWNYAEEHCEDFDLSGRFCRVGDESADVEERSFGEDYTYELCSVSTSINSDINFDAPDRRKKDLHD